MYKQEKKDKSRILPLYYFDHTILRQRSLPIVEINESIHQLATDMIDSMYAHYGIGLAAPQIGQAIQLVVIDVNQDYRDKPSIPSDGSPGEAALLQHMPLVLINPRLTDFSPHRIRYKEGCLSIPKVHADVGRPEYVKLEAQLLDGSHIAYRCGGLLSRCLQHECDHLNGILFIDYLDKQEFERLQKILDQLKAMTKKGETDSSTVDLDKQEFERLQKILDQLKQRQKKMGQIHQQ